MVGVVPDTVVGPASLVVLEAPYLFPSWLERDRLVLEVVVQGGFGDRQEVEVVR